MEVLLKGNSPGFTLSVIFQCFPFFQDMIYNEEVVLDDSSLSEAAEEYGITRQGVHDMIRRINLNLEDYEKKLGLVAKFLDIKTKIILESM